MDVKHTDTGSGTLPSVMDMPFGMNMPSGLNLPSTSTSSGSISPSSMTANFNDIFMIQIRRQFESQAIEMRTRIEKADKACKDAIIERDSANERAERARMEAVSNKGQLDVLQMALTPSRLELQHQAETVTLATTQTESASREAASARADLNSVQMELQTCKIESQQNISTFASVTARLDNADKAAASAKAEMETLRTQLEASKQVQQQQTNAIQNMTEEAKRYGTELLQTRSSLETSKLEIGQKVAMIEQLNRDRDVERNAARQEREKQNRALQTMSEDARRGQDELQQTKQLVDGLRRELDQRNDQINQIVRRTQDANNNPLKNLFPW